MEHRLRNSLHITDGCLHHHTEPRKRGTAYMSGHSKWATTKHKKAAIDAKRGKLYACLLYTSPSPRDS